MNFKQYMTEQKGGATVQKVLDELGIRNAKPSIHGPSVKMLPAGSLDKIFGKQNADLIRAYNKFLASKIPEYNSDMNKIGDDSVFIGASSELDDDTGATDYSVLVSVYNHPSQLGASFSYQDVKDLGKVKKDLGKVKSVKASRLIDNDAFDSEGEEEEFVKFLKGYKATANKPSAKKLNLPDRELETIGNAIVSLEAKLFKLKKDPVGKEVYDAYKKMLDLFNTYAI